MICLKICTFVVSKTTLSEWDNVRYPLWFAWKSVPLWYLKQPGLRIEFWLRVVICLKICTFVVSKTTPRESKSTHHMLWFAWKSVPLWYLKQPSSAIYATIQVVICLKICTFVVSKTTCYRVALNCQELWFAWKSVPLWYLKQLILEREVWESVVICLKICTFVVSKTTLQQC